MKRICAAALSTAGLVLGSLVAAATPAAAGQGTGNPVLGVSSTVVSPDRVVDITVTGTDYLVPPYAEGTDVFGGVYVFFGWVADPNRFGPSIRNSENNDGAYGITYAYPGTGGDANVRDDGSGVVRLVSFTEGGESGEATDFHMDRDGNWSTTLRIYGSTFTTTVPATGETRTFDCTQVQCGVFTIGAHGIASATNEEFVPIAFAAPDDPAPVDLQSGPSQVSTGAAPAPAPAPAPATTTAATTPSLPATTDDSTAATIAAASSGATDDVDGPPAGIDAGAVSVRSTGSSAGQLAAIVTVGALLIGGGFAVARWRARRRTPTDPTAAIPTNQARGFSP